jgi:hypothetical protein
MTASTETATSGTAKNRLLGRAPGALGGATAAGVIGRSGGMHCGSASNANVYPVGQTHVKASKA